MKRLKRRYLALQLDLDCMPIEKKFMDAVWGAVTQMFGEYGASMASLALISYDCEKKLAVIRVNLDMVNKMRAALATVTSIGGEAVAVHVIAVSGTIRALRVKMGY